MKKYIICAILLSMGFSLKSENQSTSEKSFIPTPNQYFLERFQKCVQVLFILLTDKITDRVTMTRRLLASVVTTSASLIQSEVIDIDMTPIQIESALQHIDSDTQLELQTIVRKKAAGFTRQAKQHDRHEKHHLAEKLH